MPQNKPRNHGGRVPAWKGQKPICKTIIQQCRLWSLCKLIHNTHLLPHCFTIPSPKYSVERNYSNPGTLFRKTSGGLCPLNGTLFTDAYGLLNHGIRSITWAYLPMGLKVNQLRQCSRADVTTIDTEITVGGDIRKTINSWVYWPRDSAGLSPSPERAALIAHWDALGE